jgi:hypothetical protein
MQKQLTHAGSSVFCICRQLNVAVNKLAQVAECGANLAKCAELIIGLDFIFTDFYMRQPTVTALGKN